MEKKKKKFISQKNRQYSTLSHEEEEEKKENKKISIVPSPCNATHVNILKGLHLRGCGHFC
jgi:hypothetical protein